METTEATKETKATEHQENKRQENVLEYLHRFSMLLRFKKRYRS